VTHEADPAWALLSEHLEQDEKPQQKLAAIVGLGFAYANTRNEEVVE